MQITLNITKRMTFILVGILLVLAVSVGVYAGTYTGPSGVGHDFDELSYGTIDGLATSSEWHNRDSMPVSCHARTFHWHIESLEDISGRRVDSGPLS